MKRNTGKTILICVGLFFCTCSDLTNPFQNKDEARAEINNWNLPDSVSINIFSTYNIPVRVLLGEHLDSFKVCIDNNRLWSSQDSVVLRNEIRPGHIYSFPFSFYDTGWQKIKLISYRNNGDSVVESSILRAVSPLKQNPISGVVGDSILLNTLPIKDKQVLYIWDFHNGVVVKEYASSLSVKITAPFISRYGQLYVEDYSGHRSPVTLFEIASQSPQKEISLICVNDSIQGDTVFTTEAQMKLRLEVSGAQQLKNASVNSQKFDENQRKGDLFLLGYNLKGLDSAVAPQKLNVTIDDDLGRSINRTFYVKFVKVTPVIYVTYPEDSLHTSASLVNVLGTVSNIRANSSLYLFARNNGKVQSKIPLTNNQPVFHFEISLPYSSNHILLELFSDSLMDGSMLARQDFYVFYDSSHIDTIAPKIRNIRCNGTLVDSVFTSRTGTMLLEIDAVDNSNKLTVTVNGQPVEKGPNELFYSTEVVLTHKKEHTVIAVQAKDSAGYLAEDTIYVRYNRLPKWDDIPLYTVANADEDNLFKISVIDPDGDPVLVTMAIPLKSGDTVINASSGQVSWKPQIADTGTYDIRLEVSDEYEVTDTFFTVLVKGKGATPVQFLTSKNDFPDTLWIGDTLLVPLREIPLSGTRPFKYKARLIDTKKTNIHDSKDSVLQWVPEIRDAGSRQLLIEISDSLNTVDSDTIEITVLLARVRWEQNLIQLYEDSWRSNRGAKAILSKKLDFTVSIGYQISFPYNPGASAEDLDFDLSGTIVFNPGDTTYTIPIKIVDDNIPENTEKFNIELLNNDSLRASVSILECEIIDNDKVYFGFEHTEMSNDESDKTDTVIVKISKPLKEKLVLSYIVDSSSTAKLGEDFNFEDSLGEVVFEHGDTQAAIIINILDDKIPEGDEKIVLKLKSDNSFQTNEKKPYDLLYANPYGDILTYTIINDDTLVRYSFAQLEMDGQEGDTVKIKVKLKAKAEIPLIVDYSLDVDPTKTNAVIDRDLRFRDNSQMLFFDKGDITKEIYIFLIDDTIPNGEVFFTLNLSSKSLFAVPVEDSTSIRYTIKQNEVEAYFASSYQRVHEHYKNPYCELMIRSGIADKSLEVYFQVVESDVDSGIDYRIGAPGFVKFKPNETKKDLKVEILNTNFKGKTKKFVLEITGVSDKSIAYIGSQSRMTFEIDSN